MKWISIDLDNASCTLVTIDALKIFTPISLPDTLEVSNHAAEAHRVIYFFLSIPMPYSLSLASLVDSDFPAETWQLNKKSLSQ